METNWYACEMKGGGTFYIQSPNRPTGDKLEFERHSIAANSYLVHYGPATFDECEQYMVDIRQQEDS